MTEQNAIRIKLGLINPVNHKEENHAFYSSLYKTEDNDSPAWSRQSLAERIYASLTPQDQNLVLDLGSGRQILEKEFAMQVVKRRLENNYHFFTVDLADINSEQLLADPKYCTHFQADGSDLPFSDEKFDVVVSNMALDFMGSKAIDETYRVLHKNGKAFFNFHHPSLIPEDLEHQIAQAFKKISNKSKYRGTIREYMILELKSLLHHKYLRDEDILFQSTDQIESTLNSHGFIVERAQEVSAAYETWWEADAIKK